MGVHEGHRDRMKREFLQGGLRHFSEPRVLELLLFYSRLQGDVNPLAHRLLEAFGSLYLEEFALVTDRGEFIAHASEAEAQQQKYGCGCFLFRKQK